MAYINGKRHRLGNDDPHIWGTGQFADGAGKILGQIAVLPKLLHAEGQLGESGGGIAAALHGAGGVIRMAFVDDAVQTHPGNGGNDAELAPGVFEHRVLLDMDFKESFNVRGIDLFSGQGIRVEPERTQCIVGGPLGVAQRFKPSTSICPAMPLLPRHVEPKFDPSSSAKAMNSMARSGLYPSSWKERSASSAATTPYVPS